MTEQESWAGPTLTAYQRQRVEAILATRAEQRRKTLCDPICNPHVLICMWRLPALRCGTSPCKLGGQFSICVGAVGLRRLAKCLFSMPASP